jgi:hypothetical protein
MTVQIGAQVMLLKNLDLTPPSGSSAANGAASQAGTSSQAPVGAGGSGDVGGSGPRQQLVNGSRGVVSESLDQPGLSWSQCLLRQSSLRLSFYTLTDTLVV